MNRKRIAVLGLYRSGSTAVAGVLHHLGVDMGAPFYDGYYESEWLSAQLRLWWDEPRLQEKVGHAERVRVLSRWIEEREQAGSQWGGMKHPLLSLCGEDLLQAWGRETSFIRCCRPLDESIQSLIKLKYRGDSAAVQKKLFAELERFFTNQQHLIMEFSDLMQDPDREVRRLIQFLDITPEQGKIGEAIDSVKPGSHAKVEVERRAAKRAAKKVKARRLLNSLRAKIGLG
jgi:hypothetical protein